MKKTIKLCNTNENGMVSEIELNNLKTKVSFGFNPDDVKYLGIVDIETLKENI